MKFALFALASTVSASLIQNRIAQQIQEQDDGSKDPTPEQIFNYCDTNKDGKLEKDEAMACAADFMLKEATKHIKAHVAKEFEKHWPEGKAYLTLEEFKTEMEKGGEDEEKKEKKGKKKGGKKGGKKGSKKE